jgi:fructokinase
MTKILAVGESLFDYFSEQKILGGAPLNFAIHAVQLGAEVAILTKLGQDELGAEIFDTLATRGVDIQYIQWDEEKETGRVNIQFDETEPNYQIVEDVAWDYLQYNENLAIAFQDYDCVYFGTLAQRNDCSRATIEQILNHFSGFKFLDLNLRKPFIQPDLIIKSIQVADGLKLNLAEAKFLQTNLNFSENLQDWLEKYNLKWIVLTQGELGTKWIDKIGEITGDRVIVNPEINADPVGAGDGVSAVVVTKFLEGCSPEVIVQKANQIGAYIASCQGATPTIPLTLLF